MSNMKSLADIMKVCSVLPLFAVAPAMADANFIKGVGATDVPVDFISNPTLNKDGNPMGLIRFLGVKEGSYIYDTEKNIMTVSPSDGGKIVAQNLFVGIQSNTSDDIVPIINVVGDKNTILTLYSDKSGVYPLLSRFAEMNIGTADNPLGTVNLEGATGNGTAIYVTGGNGNVHAADQALNIYANNISIKDPNEAMTGNEGNLNLVANNKLDIRGAINAYNKDAYGGRAGMVFNINQNDGNTAKTTIVGDITAAKGAEVNIGLKGEGSSITGNIVASASSELPGGKIDLAFGTNGKITGNITATDGGNIFVVGDDDVEIAGRLQVLKDSHFVGDNVNFDGLYSETNGGAIYNNGDLTIRNGELDGNKIISGQGDGGAIYSNVGSLVLENTDFENNSVKANPGDDYGYGGAIFVQGGTVDIQGTEKEFAEFSENSALTAGAVYVSKRATGATIKNVKFENNAASDIGALGIFGKDTTLTNLLFEGNRATGEFAEFDFNDGGGALFFGSEAQAVLDNGVFRSNESAGVGGAIATRSPNKGDNSAAKLDVLNSTFSKNVAETQGGAIYTAFYNSKEAINHIYVANTTFVANKAEEGGAIYNEGMADRGQNYAAIKLSDVTFKDNHASSAGGAIYNAKGGTVALSGKNTFADNTVDKAVVDNHSNNIHKNDIHNDGELNIIDGVTTIGGGVTGSGTLNLAAGATLDIGTSAIIQDVMNIDGTLVASVLNNSRKSFGRLDGTVNVGDTAKLQLNVGAVGTYDIFAGQFIDADRITVGNAYTAHATEKGIVIETKAIEDLAADTGLTTQAAGMIAGLANSDNKSVQSISLMAQEALNAGDVEFVEQEMAKLNPTSTPVAQAVSASVQNQVLSLTAGRMSGVGTTVGRAGGSASQQSGFWLQGLFNKSKYEGQFHGYTRGFAFGGDTVLDRVLTLGGGFAYNNTDVHATDGRHTDIDSKTLFAYAQYKPNKWYANLTATYSMSEYNEDVSVLGVLSNVAYDVDAYGAQFMTGYDFASGVTTEIGARYMHVDQDAYVNAVGGNVQADKTNFLSGVAGLKYAFTIKNNSGLKFRPELRAAATYDFINDGAVATVVMPGAASYQVSGDSLSRLGGEFGVGLTAQFNGGDLSIMYDLDLHTDYTSHTGMVKFRGWF